MANFGGLTHRITALKNHDLFLNHPKHVTEWGMTGGVKVVLVSANDSERIKWIASKMRETLIEVIGKEQGESMYSQEWLVNRVTEHLDGRLTGQVLLAESHNGEPVGHLIVREDRGEQGQPIGLLATVYIVPEWRRQQVASQLIDSGEKWIEDRGLLESVTYTDQGNKKLIELYYGRGYKITSRDEEKQMVILSRKLLVN